MATREWLCLPIHCAAEVLKSRRAAARRIKIVIQLEIGTRSSVILSEVIESMRLAVAAALLPAAAALLLAVMWPRVSGVVSSPEHLAHITALQRRAFAPRVLRPRVAADVVDVDATLTASSAGAWSSPVARVVASRSWRLAPKRWHYISINADGWFVAAAVACVGVASDVFFYAADQRGELYR